MKRKNCLLLVLLWVSQLVFGADTFMLTRASVIYSTGQIFDSLQPGTFFNGTMILDGNRVTQNIGVAIGGNTASIGISATVTRVSNGTVTLLDNFGRLSNVVLVSCCNPIVTFAHTPDYSEVDQWVLVSSNAARALLSRPEAPADFGLEALPGTGIAAGVSALGLNP